MKAVIRRMRYSLCMMNHAATATVGSRMIARWRSLTLLASIIVNATHRDERGSAEILNDDQQAQKADRHEHRKQAAEEAIDLFLRLREPRGQEEHDGPLGQFRRLNLHRPELDPTACTIDRHADVRHEHQQARDRRDDEGPHNRRAALGGPWLADPGIIKSPDDEKSWDRKADEDQLLESRRGEIEARLVGDAG